MPPRQPLPDSRPTLPAILLAGAVASANLGYLAVHFAKESRWLAQYRIILAHIPEQGVVLPVYTGQSTASILDHLHAASFAVIDRHAITLYLFAGDRGNPMKYFPVCESALYRYLLVMKPFKAERIPVKTRSVAENSAAALLAIE